MLNPILSKKPRQIALVHEWFTPRSKGGAENVVKSIDEMLIDAGINVDFAALVDGESMRNGSWLYGRSIKTSFVQKLPFGSSHVQQYLPLLPFAIEQIDLHEFPLVISSNHLVAKGVLLSPDQLHISYVHTPVRYAWDQMNVYLNHSFLSKYGFEYLIRWQLHRLRQWDQLSAARVDLFCANSRFTARRIYRYWGRDSTVIHPPVSVDKFRFDLPREEYYLCLSRLVPNKRVDLVVEAFNKLNLPLIVIGEGPQKSFLKKIAGPNIKIIGYQSKEKVQEWMGRCRAFVYAGLEDFGIAPVEAMAAGSPVIAFGQGGLLDTVRCIRKVGASSSTGILFPDQTVSSLVDAVKWFEDKKLWKEMSSENINIWATRFSKKVFKKRFENFLWKAWEDHRLRSFDSQKDPGEI